MNNVLFLCTGNSCRSQMAEALVNTKLDKTWKAYSAGTHPEPTVNHFTIDALAEIGIDHSESRPKHYEEFNGINFDLVITVCDSAAQECPLWMGPGERTHMPFVDPHASRDLKVYQALRDEMIEKIIPFLDTYGVQCTG